ncbi:MAG: alcohol dehydrogenase catalytic domain-containing protein, partial [Sphingopyxis sp.]|nr:alcohol dehydrogenase catalytic domain-containing protein [Sphingopyxis sp.]
MQAIEAFIETQGGPEVIDWREVTLGDPGPGQVLVRQTAVGLNYIDTYHRDGTYPIELPGGLGVEAAGEVLAIGPDVHGLA